MGKYSICSVAAVYGGLFCNFSPSLLLYLLFCIFFKRGFNLIEDKIRRAVVVEKGNTQSELLLLLLKV